MNLLLNGLVGKATNNSGPKHLNEIKLKAAFNFFPYLGLLGPNLLGLVSCASGVVGSSPEFPSTTARSTKNETHGLTIHKPR